MGDNWTRLVETKCVGKWMTWNTQKESFAKYKRRTDV